MVRVSLIVAVGENGIIGAAGGLPWLMSSDLKSFRRITMGKPIVMGRKTFQTLKKPLDGRDNIVVTRDPAFEAAGVTVANSFADAMMIARTLAWTKGEDEVLIIGGADIYAQALPLAERVYLTEIHASPEGDVRFPALEPGVWKEVSSEALPRGERDDHASTLKIFERVHPGA